jgi:hypothetical protein
MAPACGAGTDVMGTRATSGERGRRAFVLPMLSSSRTPRPVAFREMELRKLRQQQIAVGGAAAGLVSAWTWPMNVPSAPASWGTKPRVLRCLTNREHDGASPRRSGPPRKRAQPNSADPLRGDLPQRQTPRTPNPHVLTRLRQLGRQDTWLLRRTRRRQYTPAISSPSFERTEM